MSSQEPDGPYVCQPFGMQDKGHWALKRIFGVSGVSLFATISGLTKEEAEIVKDALRKMGNNFPSSEGILSDPLPEEK